MDALELPLNNKSSVVDWEAFLKLKTVLKYFTATKDQYLEFWMKVSHILRLIFLNCYFHKI